MAPGAAAREQQLKQKPAQPHSVQEQTEDLPIPGRFPGPAQTERLEEANPGSRRETRAASHWDRLPPELIDAVLACASPLTRFLHGRMGPARALGWAATRLVWLEAIASDWRSGCPKSLFLLPDIEDPVVLGNADLALVRSRSMYHRLCARFPVCTEVNPAFALLDKQANRYFSASSASATAADGGHSVDEDNTESDTTDGIRGVFDRMRCLEPDVEMQAAPFRLLHVPMRHMWLDLIGDSLRQFPIARVYDCIVAGHTNLLRHLASTTPATASGSGTNSGHIHLHRIACLSHPDITLPHQSALAIDVAAAGGFLDIVKMLHHGGCRAVSARAISASIRGGHLDTLKWLCANIPDIQCDYAIRTAIVCGNIEALAILHRFGARVDVHDMDAAAARGHIDIVRFLHENTDAGCTYLAMNWAAENGHLDTVQFLHYHRHEGCTTDAIDKAAENGHIDVLRFLITSRYEGFTIHGLEKAKNEDVVRDMVQSLGNDRRIVLLRQAEMAGVPTVVARLDGDYRISFIS